MKIIVSIDNKDTGEMKLFSNLQNADEFVRTHPDKGWTQPELFMEDMFNVMG